MVKEADNQINLINNIDTITDTFRTIDRFADFGDPPRLQTLT